LEDDDEERGERGIRKKEGSMKGEGRE